MQRYRIAVPGPGPGVQLENVDPLHPEVLQALLDVLTQVGRRVPLLCLAVGRGRPVALHGRSLRCDEELALSLLEHLADEPFASPITVARRRIDEGHPPVDRGVQCLQRLGVVLRAPPSPDGPCSKPYLGHLQAGLAQISVLHASKGTTTAAAGEPARRSAGAPGLNGLPPRKTQPRGDRRHPPKYDCPRERDNDASPAHHEHAQDDERRGGKRGCDAVADPPALPRRAKPACEHDAIHDRGKHRNEKAQGVQVRMTAHGHWPRTRGGPGESRRPGQAERCPRRSGPARRCP